MAPSTRRFKYAIAQFKRIAKPQAESSMSISSSRNIPPGKEDSGPELFAQQRLPECGTVITDLNQGEGQIDDGVIDSRLPDEEYMTGKRKADVETIESSQRVKAAKREGATWAQVADAGGMF